MRMHKHGKGKRREKEKIVELGWVPVVFVGKDKRCIVQDVTDEGVVVLLLLCDVNVRIARLSYYLNTSKYVNTNERFMAKVEG